LLFQFVLLPLVDYVKVLLKRSSHWRDALSALHLPCKDTAGELVLSLLLLPVAGDIKLCSPFFGLL
jgi:hypothetical protein